MLFYGNAHLHFDHEIYVQSLLAALVRTASHTKRRLEEVRACGDELVAGNFPSLPECS